MISGASWLVRWKLFGLFIPLNVDIEVYGV